jgi:hypothetical protein
MADGVLLNWLATSHDPFYSSKHRAMRLEPDDDTTPGPSLQLITDPTWGPRFGRHVVLYQPEHEAQVRALEAAARLRRPDLGFEAHCIPLASPIDHLEIFDAVSSLASRLNDRFPPRGRDGRSIDGHEYFICISQGTPSSRATPARGR